MSTNAEEFERDINMHDRFATLLKAATTAGESIENSHPETFKVCKEALEKCRIWVDTKHVAPQSLSTYIDADETTNPLMQESIFRNDPDGLNALIFLTLVVGHIAHYAYLHANQPERMSEAIAEAGENIRELLVDYGKKYGLVSFV